MRTKSCTPSMRTKHLIAKEAASARAPHPVKRTFCRGNTTTNRAPRRWNWAAPFCPLAPNGRASNVGTPALCLAFPRFEVSDGLIPLVPSRHVGVRVPATHGLQTHMGASPHRFQRQNYGTTPVDRTRRVRGRPNPFQVSAPSLPLRSPVGVVGRRAPHRLMNPPRAAAPPQNPAPSCAGAPLGRSRSPP